MKKRTVLLFAAMIMALCANAQEWSQEVKQGTNPFGFSRFKATAPNRTTITPSEGQVWWGYMAESDLSSSTTVGVGSPASFLAAFKIPANHKDIGGATIKAIRVYIADGLASTMSDVKVWVSTSLPATADAVDYVQGVKSVVDGANDIVLNTPYAINNQAIYVGYALTSSYSYPILSCGEDAPDAFLLSVPGSIDWDDLNGNGFGKLALQILVEGGTFADDSATPKAVDYQVAPIGGTATFNLPVTNSGLNDLTSIDYTITTDGETSAEQHADVASPIAFNATGNVEITIDADSEKGLKNKTLTITKVNGVENAATNKSITFPLYTVAELATHRVVVEEYTGTGCGYCPRGIVGMEKLRNKFGDLFVGIAVHQYNSGDAMYIATNSYAKLNFDGAPQCTIDRRYYTDPYYGNGDDICDDFAAVQSIPTLVDVNVEANWNEDESKVDAKATVQSLVDDANYNIEYVLIGDGITGTASGFKQSNYYSSYSPSQLPDDLADFGRGGKYGQSSVSGLSFNDVALSSSYVSGTNKAAKLTNLSSTEPAISEYTLSLPTKTTLKNAIDKEQVYVAALIIDNSGIIVNAAKAKVMPYVPTGITTVNQQSSSDTRYYTIDGKHIDAPVKGVNIVKYSDGTTRKVVIK